MCLLEINDMTTLQPQGGILYKNHKINIDEIISSLNKHGHSDPFLTGAGNEEIVPAEINTRSPRYSSGIFHEITNISNLNSDVLITPV